MLSSSFWRSITLAELCSMRSISMRLEVVMITGVFGCSRITTGRLPMWSRWQCVMMMRSSVMPAQQAQVGNGGAADLFRVQAAVDQDVEVAELENRELAPMPPSRFRSVSFIQAPTEDENAGENENQFPLRRALNRGSGTGIGHVERRQQDMDLAGRVRRRRGNCRARAASQSGHMVAVVGKLLAGGEARGLADDLVALDHEAGAVGVLDDPFAARAG